MSEPVVNHYPRQPRVGDVLEVYVGLVTVESVHDRGRELYVRDGQGRRLYVKRSERGCWFRPSGSVSSS